MEIRMPEYLLCMKCNRKKGVLPRQPKKKKKTPPRLWRDSKCRRQTDYLRQKKSAADERSVFELTPHSDLRWTRAGAHIFFPGGPDGAEA